MDSTQIIKRRLAQLKRMSIQLKQSTQNHNQLDYNIVYGILQATKSSASMLAEIQQSEARATPRADSPLSKLLAMTATQQPYRALFPQTQINGHYSNTQKNRNNNHTHSSGSYIKIRNQPQHTYPQSLPYQDTYYLNNQQPYQQQTQQFIGTLSHSQNTHPYIHPHQSEQQVISLREQNSTLQKTILSMKHQVIQLKEKLQTISKEQQWKAGLPFFRLNQKIQAFYTRMKVSQGDYGKIDYVQYDAQLTLDRLVVKKSSGAGTPKQLDLSELREVHYVDSIVMFLHFGVLQGQKSRNSTGKDDCKHEKNSTQQFFQNLFIKFNNEQQLHRWDLALYINFKIIQSLKKDKLFLTHLRRSRSKSRKRSSQSRYQNHDSNKKSKRSSDNIFEDDQDLMKKLVQRRDLYLETKKIVSERMIEKVNQRKILQSSAGKKPQKDQTPYEDAQQFSETHPFEIRDQDNLTTKSKFNYIVKDQNGFEQNQGEKSQRANTSKFKDLMASGKMTLSNVQNVIIPGLNLSNSTTNQRGLSFNPGQHELSLSKKLQEQRIKQASQLKKLQQSKTKKIQQIIKKLTQQGYDLTKYSKDGFSPHDKRFFLSQDLKKLCWQQQGGKSRKSIEMKSIKQVMLQKIGEGIRKHIKSPKRQEHCIISYIKDGKIKVIQLGANSTVMAQFVDELITIIDHLKVS